MIISRKMRWVRHMACMGEMRNAYKMLLGKLGGEGTFGRVKHTINLLVS
jgi:hypothetical protein